MTITWAMLEWAWFAPSSVGVIVWIALQVYTFIDWWIAHRDNPHGIGALWALAGAMTAPVFLAFCLECWALSVWALLTPDATTLPTARQIYGVATFSQIPIFSMYAGLVNAYFRWRINRPAKGATA